ncbi:SRPBCC family protein [Merismopedia glauca]|uniref:Cyclase n=1 Tax=Merismopedia glauca CCAP 1448/3 TaxID=1296344 RepID=A0A2T1C516_9CYAN|nr:SRPBCC family protein [Merismopedia glauca]PSB03370.1 cyclase [Merismopedia glauca CCAP 1448/3]
MLHFEYSSLIEAPVDIVWKFYEREDILQLLTPPWQPVEVIRHQGRLDVGAISEFKLHLGIIPITWISTHTQCEPKRLFVDKQTEGIVNYWVHRHEFISLGDQTRLIDAIAYSLPGNWLAESLIGWWVNSRLEDMFCYRHRVTQRECEVR